MCINFRRQRFPWHRFSEILTRFKSLKEGGVIFGYYIQNHETFGVVEFDDAGNVLSVDEKP